MGELAWLGVADRSPRVPGDLEDHQRDREPDERVGAVEAEPELDGARDDAE